MSASTVLARDRGSARAGLVAAALLVAVVGLVPAGACGPAPPPSLGAGTRGPPGGS